MQSLRSLLVPAMLTTWMCHASEVIAQAPTTPKPAVTSGAESQTPAAKEPAQTRRRSTRRGSRRAGFTVIEAGMVHPVSGPPIENGVVIIRGERIFAIGQQGELQLPPNTKVFKFPEGHVYPGLVDASTDVFTDAKLRNDGSLTAANKISDGLMWTDSRDDHLVEHGITTAYVNVRSGAQMPGLGAIVRPRSAGFDIWESKEQAALQLRMTSGKSASHPLQRQAKLESVDRIFDGLDDYRDAQEKFEKDVEKYNEDFEKYLEYHSKKSGKGDKGSKKDDKPAAKTEPSTAESPAAPPSRRGRRGGGRPPRGETPPGGGEQQQLTAETFEKALTTALTLVGKPATQSKQDPKPGRRQGSRPQGAPSSQAKPAAAGGSAEKTSKTDGPKRPTYPKKPTESPQKDALAQVIDGKIPLRIEAHRIDELRAALRLQSDREIPLVVLEQAYGAGPIAKDIADNGATVVLTDVLPFSLGAPGETSNPYAKFDPTALPKQLNAAGVPFAIAGGTARMSAMLPMMAASAIGRGLSEEAALRALTLTPAEILGVAKDTGSLTRNKLADVIVTAGPLFASDSRMLLVLARGRTEYEAK